MANPQQELNQIKAQIESLKQQLGKQGIDVVNIKDLDTAKALLRGLQDEVDDLSMSFRDMSTTLANIVGEISKSDSATKNATKAYKGLVSVAQKMQYEEEGIYSYNVKQLDNLHKQAKTQLTNLKTAVERLKTEEDTSEEAQALTKAYETQLRLETSLSAAISKRLELEKKVEKTFGATGALVEGTSKLFSALGFGHLSSELSELNDKLKSKLREELDKAGSSANKIGLAFKYMSKGLTGAVQIFVKGLVDPLFIVGKIVDGFLEVNKAAVEYQRLTGQNAVNLAGQNSQLATSAQVLKVMAEITKQTGLAAGAIFSAEDLGRLAEAENLLGLSAEQAGRLGINSKLVGTSVNKYEESIVQGVNKFNSLNNTAISHGVVMQDVLNTSEDITLSLGNSGDKLALADAAARKLGLSLQDVDKIASKVLDFESSIGSELEAQLLTGKDISLAKAREYALSNNLEGLSKELAKNGASATEFANMNRLAQESLAEALGMSRQELAKSIMLQQTNNNLTDEQKANAIGVTVEQMKQMEVQQKLETSLAKLAQAFAPILDILVPIVNLVSSIITPIAKLISQLAGGPLGTFLKDLTVGLLIFQGIYTTISTIIGMYEVFTALQQTGNVLAGIFAVLQETTLGSIVAQGVGMLQNLGKLALQIPLQLELMSAALATNAAMTFGVGVAVAVAAALAGYAAIKAMTADDAIIPGYGKRTLIGPEGAIQFNDKDTIVAGTNLGGKSNKTVGEAKQESAAISMAGVEAKLDTLIGVVRQGTNIYLDGKKISTSVSRNLPTVSTYTK